MKGTLTGSVPYEGTGLPSSEEELFQLNSYVLFDKNVLMDMVGEENTCKEIIQVMYSELIESEKEFHTAHENNDWQKIKFLADRQRDGALYCGTIRLRYACQFLESYCETKKTAYREALYEQAVNVIAQTKKGL